MSLDLEQLRRLQADLHGTDPLRRQAALERLAQVVEGSTATVLSEALSSDSEAVREQALALLAKMASSGDPVLARAAAAVRGIGQGA